MVFQNTSCISTYPTDTKGWNYYNHFMELHATEYTTDCSDPKKDRPDIVQVYELMLQSQNVKTSLLPS